MTPNTASLPAALVLATFVQLGGCALTPETIRLSYTPQACVEKLDKADTAAISVQVIDSRKIKDKVSVKKNGYGMEMAEIRSEEKVGDVLQRAIEVELSNRGFQARKGSTTVVAELRRFYSDFKVGFFSGEAVAELVMDVRIQRPDGKPHYTSHLEAEGIQEGVMLMGGDNAKAALDAVLKNAMIKLFALREFIDGLLVAGGTSE